VCLATETYAKKKAPRKAAALHRLHSLTLVKPRAAPRAAAGGDSLSEAFSSALGIKTLQQLCW